MKSYQAVYGMNAAPFVRNMPADRLFENSAITEAAARMKYTIDQGDFGIVVGQPGVGKSTLTRRIASLLPQDEYTILYLSDSHQSPRWLYSGLLEQLGGNLEYYRYKGKRALIRLISQNAGKKTAAIIDEAHLLDHEMLEETRFFLNTQFDSESPMSLFLVGQTELWDRKINTQAYAAIRQRIGCKIVLSPLDRAETGRYITHQLRYAGASLDLFDDKAIDRIYSYSGGIPRVINSICDKTLVYGAQNDKKHIDQYSVDYVVTNESLAV